MAALGSAQGAKKNPLGLEYRRDLTRADIEDCTTLPVGATVPQLVRLTYKHHATAQQVAEGKSGAEISAMTGYTANRISQLKSDPAFMELVEFYKEQNIELYAAAHAKLAMLGVAAVEELQDRLEDNPESFSIRETIEVAEMALDRSIAPTKGSGGGRNGGPAGGSGVVVNIQFEKPKESGTLIDVIPTRQPGR